ncbi:MAG: hypothetical protein HYX76_03985 [Acidobacteria bacterium]|nr:hypothetical protein [Acidobacteriota bacterium]
MNVIIRLADKSATPEDTEVEQLEVVRRYRSAFAGADFLAAWVIALMIAAMPAIAVVLFGLNLQDLPPVVIAEMLLVMFVVSSVVIKWRHATLGWIWSVVGAATVWTVYLLSSAALVLFFGPP